MLNRKPPSRGDELFIPEFSDQKITITQLDPFTKQYNLEWEGLGFYGPMPYSMYLGIYWFTKHKERWCYWTDKDEFIKLRSENKPLLCEVGTLIKVDPKTSKAKIGPYEVQLFNKDYAIIH